ncbi:hypothetical protein AK812_SmicGene47403, partial [Symbiodinium microadriaticum]
AEVSHPQWNSFKRALKDAQLQESVLKLSVAANYSHGSFLSGDKWEKRKEALAEYLDGKGVEYFDDLAGELGYEADDDGFDYPILDASELLQCAAIRRRGKYVTWQVKNKAWFGMNASFRDMIKVDDEDDAAEEEEPDEDDEGAADPAGSKKILTKADLYKVYAGKGPTSMFAEFMLDNTLRQHAVVITAVGAPLEQKYADDLQDISAVVFSIDFAVKLGITMHLRPPLEFDAAEEEMELLETAATFANHLAGNIAWSQVQHRYTLPPAACVLLDEDPLRREEGHV